MNIAANEYKPQSSPSKYETGRLANRYGEPIALTPDQLTEQKMRGTGSKGILRQPTTKFPFEDKQYLRPHITKRPPDRLHAEVGAFDSGVPASDVIKVHAYRRRGVPVKQDRDLSLVFDKAPIKKGDVVVGKTFAPESSLPRREDRNTRQNKNSNASDNNAPTRGARSPEW